jgi:hypothetical protein
VDVGFFKDVLLKIIDSFAPLTSKRKNKPIDGYPWLDLELLIAKNNRDYSYRLATKSKLGSDWELYKSARKYFNCLNRQKINHYFASKSAKDFKNSKKFWKFYKSLIKLRSDTSLSDCPDLIFHNGSNYSEPLEIYLSSVLVYLTIIVVQVYL